MEDPLYREIILEHWQHPHNYGTVARPDIDETGFNPLCGDEIHLTATTSNKQLVDIAFTAQGCAIAKAAASLLTDGVKGSAVATISAMTAEDMLGLLGLTLTPARTKCALLAYQTLQRGLA